MPTLNIVSGNHYLVNSTSAYFTNSSSWEQQVCGGACWAGSGSYAALFYSLLKQRALYNMTHSPIHTHSHIFSDGCIWGQLGVPRMPKRLEQPGIKMPIFQLEDNLLYLVSNSHAGILFLVANVGDMLTFTQWQLSTTESYWSKKKEKRSF